MGWEIPSSKLDWAGYLKFKLYGITENTFDLQNNRLYLRKADSSHPNRVTLSVLAVQNTGAGNIPKGI